MKDLSQHPCFNKEAHHKFARVHLPVAPQCNIKCNYCNRKYDCVNESRPGVTSNVLTPEQALHYTKNLVKIMPELRVVGIAGPGDPFANPVQTMETLRLIRKEFPEMLLCVSTNGLNLAPYVAELKELDVTHVTVTMNSLKPEVLEKIYAWVRYDKRGYFGAEAATVLLDKQLEAIDLLQEAGVTTKVNSIVIPGINDKEIPLLAEYMGKKGVKLMNTIPLFPVEGTPYENLTEPSSEFMKELRAEVEEFLPPMSHCSRCRADAAGLLGKDSAEAAQLLSEAAKMTIAPGEDRPYVAVASHEGILVNQHLGEADRVHVFKETPNGYKLVNVRVTPPHGGGDQRWVDFAEVISDCRAILVGGAGKKPMEILAKNGVQTIQMTGMIDQGLDSIYKGIELRAVCKTEMTKCGSGCSGKATGCG